MFTVCLAIMDADKVVLVFTFVQMLLVCLRLKIQLIYYIEEQRRMSARRRHCSCFERNRKSLVLFVDSEDSDWLACLYPSPYTAAHRFGMVIIPLNGVFMRVDVNDNFFEKRCCVHDVIFENGGGEIFVSLNTLLCVNVA